jgi:transcriptional regulator with PAS, ATPase and Fis domain
MNGIFLDWNNEEEVIQSIEEDIIVTNSEGRIIKASKGSGTHYGIGPESLLGRSVYDLQKEGVFQPAITPIVLHRRKKVILVQTALSGKKILITGIPVFNEAGEIEQVVSYSYDISELLLIKEYLGNLEEEMQSVKEELAALRKKTAVSESVYPSTREGKDILALIHYFVQKYSKQAGRVHQLDDELIGHLLHFEWDGKVKELEGLVEQLIANSSTVVIKKEALPKEYRHLPKKEDLELLQGRTLPQILEEVERKVILGAKEKYKTTTEMAKELGISQPSVVRKLKKYE